jgi:pyruvate dehydrogenase E1 component
MPQGVEEGIVKGMYLLRRSSSQADMRVQLMGAGTILREVEAAAEMLEDKYGVAADVWSLTSVNELQREGKAVQRWNMLHPEEEPKVPYVTALLRNQSGPFIAATDYIKSHTDQIREFVPGQFTVLGTDGFGRSDTRQKLRRFFEVSCEYVVLAALKSLADEGKVPASKASDAMRELGIAPDKIDPMSA